jgi:hypothetical protein
MDPGSWILGDGLWKRRMEKEKEKEKDEEKEEGAGGSRDHRPGSRIHPPEP